MQSQDFSSSPRRPLDQQDYLEILVRQKTWILAPLLVALVASVAGAFLWPDTYVSTAIIRVVPPQVPENFVPANINVDVEGRINSLVQLILNRATLTNIIHTHGLYPRQVARLPLDDIIEEMRRKDIKVLPVPRSINQAQGRNGQQYPSFEIRFAYSNRFTAQKVTTDLVARFLEENVREVSQQTVSTTQFLRDQWEESKKKLDGFEQKLSAFRARNIGRLPEEQQNNYQQLAVLQAQKLNLNMSMNRVNQERVLDDNQLHIYREQLRASKDPSAQERRIEERNEKLIEKEREIGQYETLLANARERYKDTHPDVQRLTNLLAAARVQREAILKEHAAGKMENPLEQAASQQSLREQRELDASIQKMQGLMQAKDLEFADYRRHALELDASIKDYEARIQGVPVGLKEYDELIRDRDLAKKDYEDLDRRLGSSEMSTALQNRQHGERLEQLDPPSLPQTPVEPQRSVLVSAGSFSGLLVGILLAAIRESRNTSLKNLKDVRAYTELPVLASISLVEGRFDLGRRRRNAWMAWSAAGALGTVLMSAAVAYHYVTKL